MKAFALAVVLLFPQWPGYLPANDKTFARQISAAQQTGNSKGHISGGLVVQATWITAVVARDKVSRRIDKERLDSREAQIDYEAMRDANVYRFFLALHSDLFPDPLNYNAIFLQRADDKTAFVRGQAIGGNYLGGTGIWNLYGYEVIVPKAQLIKSLNDVIELSVTAGGSTAIAKFKIKDIAARLEDL